MRSKRLAILARRGAFHQPCAHALACTSGHPRAQGAFVLMSPVAYMMVCGHPRAQGHSLPLSALDEQERGPSSRAGGVSTERASPAPSPSGPSSCTGGRSGASASSPVLGSSIHPACTGHSSIRVYNFNIIRAPSPRVWGALHGVGKRRVRSLGPRVHRAFFHSRVQFQHHPRAVPARTGRASVTAATVFSSAPPPRTRGAATRLCLHDPVQRYRPAHGAHKAFGRSSCRA